MKTGASLIPSALAIFRQYKTLADKAILQIPSDAIHTKLDEESNSIYLIMKHMSGNMQSRWTDFLTTDGEKPWRNRDVEFEDDQPSAEVAIQYWEQGWNCLFSTLECLTEKDLGAIVTIRGEEHSVMEAINRQIAHYAYHVGQIVFIAKVIRSADWQTLSIAKGQSAQFNHQFKS
jgi:hypothetical protein